tara:strand:+ start:1153 stop:1617 length:465 start_codon:yes stop_codon:yes gene_type:complete
MTGISLIKHFQGAPGLRLFGLGPGLRPMQGLEKLQIFLEKNTFWANQRNKSQLRKMLANSSVVISLWKDKKLIGFGRATSDKIFRAVLWDVVVSNDQQGSGLGRLLVEALLKSPCIKNAEKIYLMTTNCSEFYEQMGFNICKEQNLLIMNKSIE